MSKSTTSVTSGKVVRKSSHNSPLLTKQTSKMQLQKAKVNEKGDANSIAKYELPVVKVPAVLSSPRRQISTPSLALEKKLPVVSFEAHNSAEADKENPVENVEVIKCPEMSGSSDSLISTPEPVCEALESDPKLKAFFLQHKISQNPNSMIGPIDRGLVIIGILQETLQDLITFKTKSAEKCGKKFHIQQSGLDVAVRALENAERSLKTIKDCRAPALGKKERSQNSAALTPVQQRTIEAVIRILINTKHKLEKMGSKGVSKLMKGCISLFSQPSSGHSRPRPVSAKSSSSTISLYRMGTGTSTLLPTSTACSRAKSSTSLTSIDSRSGSRK